MHPLKGNRQGDGRILPQLPRCRHRHARAEPGAGSGASLLVCPGDDLLARQPICDAIFRAGASFILTARPASHKTLHEELSRRPVQTLRRTVTTGKRKITRRVHSYRWLEDVPIRTGAVAFGVTWIGHEVSEPASGKVRQSFARMTNLPVDRHNVREIAECGRARWKVENEGFNRLKNNGYHLDRNFGHGSENLASVLLVLNLLAFAMHTACNLAETAWQDARQAAGSRDRMFRQLQVLAARMVFEARASLLDVVADKVEIPPWPGAGQPLQGSRTHPKNEETPDTQADDAIMRIAALRQQCLAFLPHMC